MDGKNIIISEQIGKVGKLLATFLKVAYLKQQKYPVFFLTHSSATSYDITPSSATAPYPLHFTYFLLCYSADKTHLLTAKCI